MNIGIIGCGAISDQYMIGLNKNKEILKVVACADLDSNKSDVFSKKHKIDMLSVEEIFVKKLVEAAMDEFSDIPTVLHQDHGGSPSDCKNCIELGFTSVMMDGSLMDDQKTPSDFDYNVRVTKETTDMAHALGVSVEGEIGCLGSLETGTGEKEDGVGAEGKLDHDQLLTDPDEASDFVKALERNTE